MTPSDIAKELFFKRKYCKFVTGDTDGVIKVWNGVKLNFDMEIRVSDHAVTAMTFMTLSKRLVVATLDRMISFYEINAGSRRNKTPTSRIENLVAVPLCLEYHRSRVQEQLNKNKTVDEKDKWQEKLLVGDDLGIISMYSFDKNWHICKWFDFNKKTSKQLKKNMLCCHQTQIEENYDRKINQIYEKQRNEIKKQQEEFKREMQQADVFGGGPKLKPLPKVKPVEYENEEKGVHLIQT
jgi:WD40 repeat protein